MKAHYSDPPLYVSSLSNLTFCFVIDVIDVDDQLFSNLVSDKLQAQVAPLEVGLNHYWVLLVGCHGTNVGQVHLDTGSEKQNSKHLNNGHPKYKQFSVRYLNGI